MGAVELTRIFVDGRAIRNNSQLEFPRRPVIQVQRGEGLEAQQEAMVEAELVHPESGEVLATVRYARDTGLPARVWVETDRLEVVEKDPPGPEEL